MDQDGVETGPEVKVPIHTYHRLATGIKQTLSDSDESKTSIQNK